MTIFATGVNKILTLNPETVFGVKGSGSGQQLRRVTSDLNLNVASLESNEILPSQQVRDARHGPRQVQGTINGQFSPGTYSALLTNLLRNSFTTGTTVSGVADSNLVIDASGLFGTLTSPSSTFITAGFATGDIVRLAGETGGAAVDNAVNCRIVGLTQTSMQLYQIRGALVGYASGQTISISAGSKKLIMALNSQNSFSIEHWYSDIGRSELYLGCKVSQLAINVPASGFITLQASLIAQNRVDNPTQQLVAPAAVSTSNSLTANGGAVYYAGAPILYISQASIQVTSDLQATPMVGSDVVPNIFPGVLRVRGSFTALFANDTMDADFLNEVETSIGLTLTTNPTGVADFVNIYIPRVKLMGVTKSDAPTAIMRSFNFVGLEAITGLDTSIVIQDSLA